MCVCVCVCVQVLEDDVSVQKVERGMWCEAECVQFAEREAQRRKLAQEEEEEDDEGAQEGVGEDGESSAARGNAESPVLTLQAGEC